MKEQDLIDRAKAAVAENLELLDEHLPADKVIEFVLTQLVKGGYDKKLVMTILFDIEG